MYTLKPVLQQITPTDLQWVAICNWTYGSQYWGWYWRMGFCYPQDHAIWFNAI